MDIDSVQFRRGPIFIAGNPKSGTTLMQALLDNHPELCVIPIEIKFFKFPNLPSLPPGNMPPSPHPDWKVPIPRKTPTLGAIKDEILSHSDFDDLLNGREISRNISISEDYLERKKFVKSLTESKVNTLRGLYISILKAFHTAMGVETSFEETCFVVKTPHLEEYAVELRNWFENSSFVHMMRNIYANIYSIRKSKVTTRYVKDTYSSTAKSLYFMERNNRYLDRYKIARFEDVIISVNEVMEEISDMCSIGYSDSMSEPTILGISWGGNSRTTNKEFESLSRKPLDHYQGRISYLDIALVNKFFSNIMCKYDYEIIDQEIFKSFLPSGFEFPTSYFLNRMLILGDNKL